jgi:hypothetical protein
VSVRRSGISQVEPNVSDPLIINVPMFHLLINKRIGNEPQSDEQGD